MFDIDIYLFIAVAFPPGGGGRQTCTKIGKRQLYTEGETIHETIHKHRIHKIENKNTKKKNIKRIFNNISQIWKQIIFTEE